MFDDVEQQILRILVRHPIPDGFYVVPLEDRFRVIADKARALVSALDVIVWAIDPKRNSLQSFADYLGSYAEELLSELQAFGRSRSRFTDLLTGLQEAFAEHLWLKIAATVVLLSLAASPLAWIYRDRIERIVSTTPFPGKNIVVVLPFQIVGNNTSGTVW